MPLDGCRVDPDIWADYPECTKCIRRPRRSYVTDSDGMLRHVAFFEELAHMEESDPAWRAVSAGLVVMRLVDNWIERGPPVVAADAYGVTAVLNAVDEIPATVPVRSILRGIVNAMVTNRIVNFHAVAPRLMAYSQVLEYDAKWTLAADVHRTILAHTHPVEDSDVVISAHIQRAFCSRQVGDVEAAAAAYEQAAAVANSVGDMIGVLRARLGEAKLAAARGNMPQAELILDETISRARDHDLTDVHSRALHDRSYV